jgi:hypothetical protein
MIAYLFAELDGWRKRHMKKTICLSALFLALIGLIGPLQPLLVALASTLVFIAAAWAEGLSPPQDSSLRMDPETFPARASEIAAGRALSDLVLWLGIAFILSPVLVASAIAWGISGGTALACLLCWLSAHILASSIKFLSKLLFEKTESLVGFCVYVLWLFSSFFSSSYRASNPFVQVWSILSLAEAGNIFAFIYAGIGAAVLVFAVSALVLGSKKRSRNA